MTQKLPPLISKSTTVYKQSTVIKIMMNSYTILLWLHNLLTKDQSVYTTVFVWNKSIYNKSHIIEHVFLTTSIYSNPTTPSAYLNIRKDNERGIRAANAQRDIFIGYSSCEKQHGIFRETPRIRRTGGFRGVGLFKSSDSIANFDPYPYCASESVLLCAYKNLTVNCNTVKSEKFKSYCVALNVCHLLIDLNDL